MISKLATLVYEIDHKKAQVEFLCSGQQAVVFGDHPETNKPYHWINESILDVDATRLPKISKIDAENLAREIELELAKQADMPEALPSRSVDVIDRPNNQIQPDTQKHVLADALSAIDPQNYDDWVAIGHALKSSGDHLLPLYLRWSKKRSDGSTPRNFVSEEDVRTHWQPFNPKRISLAAVFRKAADAGWTGDSPFVPKSNSHTKLARYILVEIELREPKPVFADGELWRFCGTNWQPVEEHEKRCLVQGLDGLRYGEKGVVHANKSLIDGVLSELHAMCAVPEFFDDAPIGLNCQSGFIRLDSKKKPELIPHAAALRQRFCITAEWGPDAKVTPSPLTERYFSGIWGDGKASIEGRTLLEEILGAACAGLGTKLKSPKAFVLHGPSAANGKSQFIHLVRGMLPRTAHSAIAPSEMGKEQFLAELVGKTANLSNELSSTKAIASDKMKAVISGDVVSAKRVYRPVYQFTPQALHLFATNILPSFHDGVDEGIRRRFIAVSFPETISESERIPEIAKRILQTKKSTILDLAVKGAARIIENGKYSIPQWVTAETEEWFQDADNLAGWLDEGGLENLLKHRKSLSYDEAYRSFREIIEERGPGEWIPRYSVFKRVVREYVKGDPELDIVRHSGGYRIVERVLV